MASNTILVENTPFPVSVGAAEEDQKRITMLRGFRKRERKLLRRVKRTSGKTSISSQTRVIRELEGSSAYRICAAVTANKKLPAHRRSSLAELFAVGRAASWNKVPEETVPVFVEPKRGGDFRTICDFDIRYRTMHYAARPTIFTNVAGKQFQYDLKGKGEFGGIAKAIQDIKSSINAGNVYFFRLDIKKFYQNIEEQRLRQALPLRKNVVSLFAIGRRMKAVVKSGANNSIHSTDDVTNQARRGAPQGSALSAKVASSIISYLDWDESIPLFNWVDDFLILGKSKNAVIEAADTLIAKVSALPGGHFTLNPIDVGHFQDGVIFLGHSIKLTNKGVEVEAAYPAEFWGPLDEMETRLGPLLYMLHQPLTAAAQNEAVRIIGDMWIFGQSWGAAFRACDHIEVDLADVETNLRNHAARAEVSWATVKGYRNQNARWKRRYS